MLRRIDIGWFILNKYYGKSDETPVSVAALVLDPSKRDAYIKQNWHKEWYESALVGANGVWEEDFNINLASDSPAVPVPMGPPQKKFDQELTRLMRHIEVNLPTSRNADDFMTFVTSPPSAISGTPLQWWCQAK